MPQPFGPMAAAAKQAGEFMLANQRPGLPVFAGLPQANALRGATFRTTAGLGVAGAPSVQFYQRPDGAPVIEITLRSAYAGLLQPAGLAALKAIAARMLAALQAYSQGPLSARQLRAAGHPYGYDKGPVRRMLPKSAARAVRGSAGVKGSAPTLGIINRQSGALERSWQSEIIATNGGVALRFFNTAKTQRGAPYPFFLMHGTVRMQAHGPWSYVPLQFAPQLNATWAGLMSTAARQVATTI